MALPISRMVYHPPTSFAKIWFVADACTTPPHLKKRAKLHFDDFTWALVLGQSKFGRLFDDMGSQLKSDARQKGRVFDTVTSGSSSIVRQRLLHRAPSTLVFMGFLGHTPPNRDPDSVAQIVKNVRAGTGLAEDTAIPWLKCTITALSDHNCIRSMNPDDLLDRALILAAMNFRRINTKGFDPLCKYFELSSEEQARNLEIRRTKGWRASQDYYHSLITVPLKLDPIPSRRNTEKTRQ